MLVRRLDVDEWELYRTVRLAALTDSPSAFGATADAEAARSDEAWRDRLAGRVQLVAEAGGVIVGTIGVLEEGDDIAEIVSMWVAPPSRGNGVGDALMIAAIASAEVVAGTVRLWVADGNTHAERLYERHGFRRTGRSQLVTEERDDRRIENEMTLVPAIS